MIRLTDEQKEENKQLRHQIIDEIMEIQDTKSLGFLYTMSKTMKQKEYRDHVLDLEDAVGMMDIDIINKVYHLFRKEKEDYLVKEQILELCEDVIHYYVAHGGEFIPLYSQE